ncbi:acyltransferase [Xanthomonas bromi]|nr:acyltransferase [Xanthomonas bromi]
MRYPALDLLRGIAILWVMLFHSFVVGGLGPDWAWVSRYGWMGVDLFFVLSGFLIGTQVLAPLARGQRLDIADFYVRRAFRILPAFLVVLLVYLLWPPFREAPGLAPWWMFATFSLNLLVDYGRDAAFSHAWSLCVEEHFYLVFPLLATLLSRRPSAARFVLLCVVVMVAGIALRAGIWLHNTALDSAGAGLQRNWFIEDIYYPTWNRLDGLLAGVVLATLKVFRPPRWQRLQQHGNALLLAGVVTLALAMWLFRERTGLPGNAVGWPVLSLGLALLVLAGTATSGVLGGLRVPGAAWLAAISYSLYLTHKAVFHLTQLWLGPALEGRGVLALVVYGAIAVLGVALLHYTVERTFLRLRDRVVRPRARRVAGDRWWLTTLAAVVSCGRDADAAAVIMAPRAPPGTLRRTASPA